MLLLFRGLKSRQSGSSAILCGKVNCAAARPSCASVLKRGHNKKPVSAAAKDSFDPAMMAG
jgi:hypothetical protein